MNGMGNLPVITKSLGVLAEGGLISFVIRSSEHSVVGCELMDRLIKISVVLWPQKLKTVQFCPPPLFVKITRSEPCNFSARVARR